MSDQAFAAATRPGPRVILRIPLLEYSLGHELLLVRYQNALLASVEDFDACLKPNEQVSAIMRAVSICSRTWAQNKKPDKWIGLWGWTIRRENFPVAIADFRNYRAEGSTFPNILPPEEEGKGRTLGAPFLARLTAYSVQVFGESAFDQPFGMLQWMYFSHAESEGACRIMNDLERQIREEIAQHEADYKREQEERKKKEGTCPP